MPRPPSKRTRPVTKTSTASNEVPQRSPRREDADPAQTLESPSKYNTDVETATQPRVNTQASGISRQARDQTPISDAQELAIESSPMGERGATGSRPPTRSRGYSSTLSVAGRKGDISSKIPGTPAFESSILSNFRRRPRQPSILQMMQAEDGSSDFDDDDFLGGFSPEDESTPLNLSRGKSLVMQSAVASSPSLPSSGGSRKRRRSLNENANPEAPLAGMGTSPINLATSPNPNHGRELRSFMVSPQTPASFALSTQATAPPLSSSLPPSPASAATLEGPRQLAIENADRESDKKISLPTTTLQDKLLPRRHQRRRKPRHVSNVEDPDNSSDDDESAGEHEEDELSYLPGQKISWPQRKRLDKSKKLPNVRNTHGAQKTAKPYGNQANSAATRPKQIKENNGNRLETDKENNEINSSSPISSPPDSDTFEAESLQEELSVNFISEELREQARKFAEVDNWEMEFEDVPASQNIHE
ncbi:uncharacterized protein KD926_001675 [Aspergillus affinis]|uniref:uncharacterized protein n=1 Tax=Aspergillus affinis TaxID=1070780 RepID=UPI0022FDE39A|nr:uncharacterized protein KD926_001675 [Aspergillus affinis]KAI9036601.1 hypothetical protein KD926_001675 [Aspergillus affinis]